jgi:hypothetical protein
MLLIQTQIRTSYLELRHKLPSTQPSPSFHLTKLWTSNMKFYFIIIGDKTLFKVHRLRSLSIELNFDEVLIGLILLKLGQGVICRPRNLSMDLHDLKICSFACIPTAFQGYSIHSKQPFKCTYQARTSQRCGPNQGGVERH